MMRQPRLLFYKLPPPSQIEVPPVLLRMVVLSVGLVMAGVMFAEFATAGELRQGESTKPLRAGIIGLDTSHVTAFTKLLNAPDAKPELAGVRVVAA